MAVKVKNKKFKFIALAEALLIVALCIPLVKLSKLNIKSENTVPAIQNEQSVQNTANNIIEESIYQNENSIEEVNLPADELSPDSSIVIPELNKNNYSFYKDKDMTTSIAGIDVSEFQGYIDWQQVKDSGIEFAFIRIGCRTYDDGGIIFDSRFKENLYSADRAGIKTGVYFFSQALTVEEAVEEADAVIKAIEPFNITYPVVFDWEIITEDYARTDDISIESLADCCVAFCERIKEAGYTPMIYQNKSTLLFKVDLPRVKEYDIWLAEYNDEPTYYYDFKIWQYTSEGRVPGISTEVDMNISYKDYSKK